MTIFVICVGSSLLSKTTDVTKITYKNFCEIFLMYTNIFVCIVVYYVLCIITDEIIFACTFTVCTKIVIYVHFIVCSNNFIMISPIDSSCFFIK